jgi:hypothetical protein
MKLLGKWLISKIEWLLGSFNSNTDPSSRKLTAFGFMLCIFYLHIVYVDHENAFEFLIADCLSILLLYGIIHASDINSFFNKDNNEDTPPKDPPTK